MPIILIKCTIMLPFADRVIMLTWCRWRDEHGASSWITCWGILQGLEKKEGWWYINSQSCVCIYLSHPCWLLKLLPNAPNSFSTPSQIQSEQCHSYIIKMIKTITWVNSCTKTYFLSGLTILFHNMFLAFIQNSCSWSLLCVSDWLAASKNIVSKALLRANSPNIVESR